MERDDRRVSLGEAQEGCMRVIAACGGNILISRTALIWEDVQSPCISATKDAPILFSSL
jgi:hypothetical protein